MGRLRQYIRAILILGCLALFVAFASIWRRSVRSGDCVQYITRAGTAYSVGIGPRSIILARATHYPQWTRDEDLDWLWPTGPGWAWKSFDYGTTYTKPIHASENSSDRNGVIVGEFVGHTVEIEAAPPWKARTLGFDFKSDTLPLRSGKPVTACRYTWAETPLWFLMILTAVPSILWLRGWLRQRRRRRRNLCIACGYSLTGNLSGVCPECGKQLSNVCHGSSFEE